MDPLEGLFGHFEKEVEGWAMMVRPVVLSGTPAEEPLLVVSCSLGRVDDPKFISVTLVQKCGDLLCDYF